MRHANWGHGEPSGPNETGLMLFKWYNYAWNDDNKEMTILDGKTVNKYLCECEYKNGNLIFLLVEETLLPDD